VAKAPHPGASAGALRLVAFVLGSSALAALLVTLFACHALESAPDERSAPRADAFAQHPSSTSSTPAQSSSLAPRKTTDRPRHKTKHLYWAFESSPQQLKTRFAETCAELDDGELVCAFGGEHGGCATERLPLGVQRIGKSQCAISGSGGVVSLAGAGCQLSSGKLSELPVVASERATCDLDQDGTAYCSEGQGPRRRMLSHVELLEHGEAFFCALRKGGDVWCWGSNVEGGLGDGRSHESKWPVRVRLAKPALALALGWKHACVLLVGGDVSCWGENSRGALGVGRMPSGGDIPIPGSPPEYLLPQQAVGLSAVVALDVDGDAACALTEKGAMFCWGDEWTAAPNPTPTRVEGLPAVAQLSMGSPRCVVTRDGETACWGQDCPLSTPQTKPQLIDWATLP
jgi:alpha-tubulin suppressor-like RCC1 family protein